MSDDKNPENAPKTGRQVALYLNRARALVRQSRPADPQTPRPEPADPSASMLNSQASDPVPRAPRPVPGKRSIAAFLWMPQLNLSLQAFTFPLALLVQTFAQILISTGLLPAQHPARHFSGAKTYGILQLLEEARQGLPPLRALWGGAAIQGGPPISSRIFVTRQYAIFASTIGVLVTGAMTLLTIFTQFFLGGARAFAQAPFTGAGSISTSGDLGIGFINAIFDSTNSSVTSGGLGDLFAFYSTTMLTFAGIIVLWIIISAVAETARTGIPFGKQFNHVWAPIRLITALALLVPLSSGLNSGQHLVIYLTKWGSQQANEMWVKFAKKMEISGPATGGGGGAPTTPGALTGIPVATDSFREISDRLFDILLCQNIYDKLRDSSMPEMGTPVPYTLQSSDSAAVLDASGNATTAKSNYQVERYSWSVPGHLNCGSANFPQLKPNTNTTEATAAGTTSEAILKEQSDQLNGMINLLNAQAQKVANAAIKAEKNGLPVRNYLSPLDFYVEYARNADAYAAARSNSLSRALQSYNSLLGLNFKNEAEQRGWISAPVWLNRIAEQNGRVLDTASVLPNVVAPVFPLTTSDGYTEDQQLARGDIQGTWNLAQEFMGNARTYSKAAVQDDPMKRATELMKLTIGRILQPSANPLGTIGGFGRQMMTRGLDLTFKSGATVLNDDKKEVPASCRLVYGKQVCTSNESADPWVREIANAIQKDISNHIDTSFGPGTDSFTVNANMAQNLQNEIGDLSAATLRPAGTMMISFGFMAGYVLPLLPFFRFMLGVLGWMLLLFEAILAVPLLAISLLKTDGEGFMTQNFQTGAVMVLALILRPIMMIFGLLLGLLAFNGIMNITNVSYMAAIGGVNSSDNTVMSMVIYMIIYGILAYTLANSAFKAIDILPNQVMSWLGARLDQRVDDASVIHQQSAQMMGNLGMVSAFGGGGKNVSSFGKNLTQTQNATQAQDSTQSGGP